MSRWRRLLAPLAPAGRQETAAPAPIPGPPSPPRRGNVVVTVLGLAGEALEGVLTLAERQCAASGNRPVFVTDGLDFAPFRQRRLVVDQVADAEALTISAPDLSWRTYRRRQYALLAARWHPVAVISFGRAPDADCLAALEGTVTPEARR